MPRYVDSILGVDEAVIYSGTVSVWSLALPLLLGVFFLLTLVWAPLGILCFLYAFTVYKTTEMAFTNKRLIAKTGFIRRKTVEVKINRIESLQVDQSILGRLFNYGTLILSGAGTPQAPIHGLKDPLAFRNEFFKFIDNHNEH